MSSFLPKPIGKIINVARENNAITMNCQNGSLSLIAYQENIFQMRYNLSQELMDYKSFAIDERGAFDTNLEINDNGEKDISICNEKYCFDFSPQSTSFSVKDANQNELIASADQSLHFHSINQTLYTHLKPYKNDTIIGLGEKTGDINRIGKKFVHSNTDAFGYSPDTDPIYSSIPFFICIGQNKRPYGIFIDNAEMSTFDFCTSNKRSYAISAETKQMNIFMLFGNTVRDIIQEYTSLTGRTPLPPRWSLGFHQSRYSYYPESNLDELVLGMKSRGVPMDAVHLDIHYMEAYKAFTVDKSRFSDFKSFIKKLKSQGIKVVAIVDPGIKIEKGYKPYEEGIKNDYFVKYFDGKLYEGSVWPGNCHFPDFTMAKVRDWWSNLCDFYWQNEVAGIWNDMNEPAVWGQHFPPYTLFDFDGDPQVHHAGRNVYGSLMNKATKESYDTYTKDNERHFVLTRAAFAGIQKYATKWTGDNVANDDHLLLASRLINALGVSGVAFSGVDIGGFVDDTKSDLFAKWVMFAVFTPFFRSHKMINSRSSEPWDYGESVFAIAKNFIQLRYRLIPYIYTSFWQTSKTGLPINNMLAIDYSNDEKIFDSSYQNQFIFGQNILVAPVHSKDTFVKVYLPDEIGWYHLFTDKYYEGKNELVLENKQEYFPVFVKAGSMIFLQPKCLNLSNASKDILEIHYYLTAKQNHVHSSIYYEDDGISKKHLNNEFFECQFGFNELTYELNIDILNERFPTKINQLQLYIHGNVEKKDVQVSSAKFQNKFDLKAISYVMLDKIPNFDPFQDFENQDICMDTNFITFHFKDFV